MEMVPVEAEVLEIRQETPDVKTVYFRPGRELKQAEPGQFIMVSLLGFGEAPFGAVFCKDYYSFTFRKVGKLTSKLFQLEVGEKIWVRGPYGRGFPLEEFRGRDILLIAGGIGIPPVKQAVLRIVEDRSKFGDVVLLYGARSKEQLVYLQEFDEWKSSGIDVRLTIDKPQEGWSGRVGFVTDLIPELEGIEDFVCFMCGPPVMMKFACKKLLELGVEKSRIFVSLERLVQCGIGICGRCQINGFYLCKHGPVFRLDELEKSLEVVW